MEPSYDVQAQDQEPKVWPKVAIVVLNWNGWQDTIECLESLQKLTYPNYQVIVVDNGSTDGSVEKIKEWARGEIPVKSRFVSYDPETKPVYCLEYDRATAEAGGTAEEEAKLEQFPSDRRVVLIRTGQNLGFAAGNNVGFRYAVKRGYRTLGPLNNDVSVTPNYLTQVVQALENQPMLMAISPKILKYDQISIFYGGGWIRMWQARWGYIGYNSKDTNQWTGIRETGFVSGACFVARADLFRTIGFFDEDFFFSNEEMAFGYKARSHGFRMAVDLDAVIYHREGSSYGDDDSFRRYYSAKYRLLMIKKYGKGFEKLLGFSLWALTRVAKFAAWALQKKSYLMKAEIQAIMDASKGRFGDYDRERSN
ncbi:MAG: N-acetylglucosaminyl-diphospho-decaprenol L-rhamnosyltransferase [Actinobacteria bacterium]|nr:N-acetylglucosaminyl-diphospho-decaprenol L-rhamnosyltransferase [Actinomycetota bacterium]